MFHEMRRSQQLLPQELTEEILKTGSTGVLAVLGDDDYPYAVPLNYVYESGKIYLHCAKAGHKIDAIRRHDKVSFCVVNKDEVVPAEFSTLFRSAIAFGRAAEVVHDAEKVHILQLLNDKYAPKLKEAGDAEIKRFLAIVTLVQIDVDHVTGKESLTLVKKRTGAE